MSLEIHYYNVAKWLSQKLSYHKFSSNRSVQNKQVNIGEIWECDLGYNIGEEKNKKRPVLVVSNNKVNRTGKVIAVCLTDAQGKTNNHNLPIHNSWYLLFSNMQNYIVFLNKDTMVQLEEIRTVSKARLSKTKFGDIDPDDFLKIKNKLKNVFEI